MFDTYLSTRVNGASEEELIEEKVMELHVTDEEFAVLEKLQESDMEEGNHFSRCSSDINCYVIERQKANDF